MPGGSVAKRRSGASACVGNRVWMEGTRGRVGGVVTKMCCFPCRHFDVTEVGVASSGMNETLTGDSTRLLPPRRLDSIAMALPVHVLN